MGRKHVEARKSDIGYEAWREVEKVCSFGYSRENVFRDWIELILMAHLSWTDNFQRDNFKPDSFDGEYEEKYLEIVRKYHKDKPVGERPVDHFQSAFQRLFEETAERQGDVVGYIYESQISLGENGQYFTPEPVMEMLASITAPTNKESGSDPAGCGSGRSLIAMSRNSPNMRLSGIDVDRRCAVMTTLNMIMLGKSANIVWGNGLSLETWASWSVDRGLVIENKV